MHTIIPVAHTAVEKPSSSILFENGIGHWTPLSPLNAASGGSHVWSNLPAVQDVCTRFGAEISLSKSQISCKLSGSERECAEFRQAIEALQPLEKAVLAVAQPRIFEDSGSMMELAKHLTKLGAAYDVHIAVQNMQGLHEHASAPTSLILIGQKAHVEFAKFKCRALLEFFSGSAVERVDLPLSLQNLVFGPCKMHLLNIFQQTAVNVYAPPAFYAGQVLGANWDQVYLVGDPVQVAVATTMVEEIRGKTEVLVKTCAIALPVLDVLARHYRSDIEEIMAVHATFIQWPTSATTVRVLGTNRKSISATISALMRVCTRVYTALVSIETASPATLLNLAKTGVTVAAAEAELTVTGTALQVAQAAAQIASTTASTITFILELDLQLKEFLAGKKNGKIIKVMTSSDSKIWFEAFHEYNLHIYMQCAPQSAPKALAMLEDELPAEQEIFIAEPYHKQIIGAGGQRIQSLMRRYNVYIKFEAVNDKVPNAFANLQLNNVLLRCPQKHSKNIGPAIADLYRNVTQVASEHLTTYLKLSRNHRRLLISAHGNLIRDIEKWSNAVIKFPSIESRNTELLEITGLGQASVHAARTLQEHLPYDYEFRVAHNKRFANAVGPHSSFALKVTAPLRAAFNAQVQAFERIQMEGDSTVYSQIMVSIPVEDDFIVNEIDAVVTGYLREHNLDIIEKGALSRSLVVEGTAAVASPERRAVNERASGVPDTPNFWTSTGGVGVGGFSFGSGNGNLGIENVTPLKPNASPLKSKLFGGLGGLERTGERTPVRRPMAQINGVRPLDWRQNRATRE